MRIIAETTPHARFPHSCSICTTPIATGERHTLIVYRDDSALDPRSALRRVRYHLRCPGPASPLPEPPVEPPKAERASVRPQLAKPAFPSVPTPQAAPVPRSPRPFSPPKPRGHR